MRGETDGSSDGPSLGTFGADGPTVVLSVALDTKLGFTVLFTIAGCKLIVAFDRCDGELLGGDGEVAGTEEKGLGKTDSLGGTDGICGGKIGARVLRATVGNLAATEEGDRSVGGGGVCGGAPVKPSTRKLTRVLLIAKTVMEMPVGPFK